MLPYRSCRNLNAIEILGKVNQNYHSLVLKFDQTISVPVIITTED